MRSVEDTLKERGIEAEPPESSRCPSRWRELACIRRRHHKGPHRSYCHVTKTKIWWEDEK